MKRQATRKMQNNHHGEHGENLYIRGAMNNMPVDEFSEQPRPNLYNVIKKLREQKGK
jgi:hypothetical protein